MAESESVTVKSEKPSPNLLQTILSNKGITNITSDHINVTIDNDDLVIHIKVPKEAATSPTPTTAIKGGSLKKNHRLQQLQSTKKANTAALSD
jgi:hypothetical protein